MKNILIALLSWSSCTLAAVDLQFLNSPKYGTNLNNGIQLESPSKPTLANSNFRYRLTLDWLEPFLQSRIDTLKASDTYLRSLSHVEISPYFAAFGTGLGIKALPFTELSIHYSHLSYLGSGVRLSKTDVTSQWNSQAIGERAYNSDGYEFIQTVHLKYRFFYYTSRFHSEILVDHQLIDIKSTHQEYFYDYSRGMPIFAKDDIFELQASLAYKLTPNWQPFIQDRFTLNNFEGDFSQLINQSDHSGKPTLYRNDLILGSNYYPCGETQDTRFNLWIKFSETSRGDYFDWDENIALGLGTQINFHFSEYKNPPLKNQGYR